MKKIIGIFLMTAAIFLLMFTHSQAKSDQDLRDKCTSNMKIINIASKDLPSNELNQCTKNLKNIATACEMYFTDHQKYPTDLKELLKINPTKKCSYFKKIPQCPSCQKDYIYVNNANQTYTISCPCESTNNHNLPKGFPAFDSKKGLMLPSEDEVKNNP